MNYYFIIIPLLAMIISQLVKMIINAINGKFTWADLTNYGGMPSSHAALVTALAALVGAIDGWTGIPFAICVITGVIVMRDALGFRRVIGDHATALNKLTTADPSQYFNENIGHTPLQVFFGSLVGLLTVIVYLYI